MKAYMRFVVAAWVVLAAGWFLAETAQAQAITIEIHSRVQGTAEYHLFGIYASEASARTISGHLQGHGFQVELRQSRKPIPQFADFVPRHVVHDNHLISPAKAVEVFNWMAGQNDIAFRYPVDGCYARAELMIERMRRQGFHPHRVWSVANGESLHACSTNVRAGFVEWGYHVAPILNVRGQDGRKHWYVIDPSLFNGPATIAQWRGAQMKSPNSHGPYINMTSVGEAPVWPDHHRKPGSGYWPGGDPGNGLHNHAVETMRRYMPWEGRASAEPFGFRGTDFAMLDWSRRTMTY